MVLQWQKHPTEKYLLGFLMDLCSVWLFFFFKSCDHYVSVGRVKSSGFRARKLTFKLAVGQLLTSGKSHMLTCFRPRCRASFHASSPQGSEENPASAVHPGCLSHHFILQKQKQTNENETLFLWILHHLMTPGCVFNADNASAWDFTYPLWWGVISWTPAKVTAPSPAPLWPVALQSLRNCSPRPQLQLSWGTPLLNP